jgi:hypothetical protein
MGRKGKFADGRHSRGGRSAIMRHSNEWNPRSKAAARKLMYTE